MLSGLLILLSVSSVTLGQNFNPGEVREGQDGLQGGLPQVGLNGRNGPAAQAQLFQAQQQARQQQQQPQGLGAMAQQQDQEGLGDNPDQFQRLGRFNANNRQQFPQYDQMQQQQEQPQQQMQQQFQMGNQNIPPHKPLLVKSPKKSGVIKLQEQPECAEDIKMYCSSSTNNFAILDCLQNDLKSDSDISESCQHLIWNYKKNLTLDYRFESAAGEVCKEEMLKLKECEQLKADGRKGKVIPCLIEHKDNITIPNCKTFLTKMASIVFSDYRLIQNLVDSCEMDITKLQCGRLHPDNDNSPHSQGRTVECLSQNVKSLDKNCKHEILRIAELQADDYHLDRPLFYACREDRERLCARTKAGNGKVYKCLLHHKFDREMSTDCREKLTQRQVLMQSNYRINKGLAQSCQRDITEHQCIKNVPDPGFKHARLSRVVLCLENAVKEGGNVDPECMIEIQEVRRSLLEDYKISPEVVSACEYDISTNCNHGINREGVTLHCLMDLARPKAVRGVPQPSWEAKLQPQCQKELEAVIREADPGADWSLDPLLRDACQPIVDVYCSDVPSHNGEGQVLSCLTEHLDKNEMNADCEERLMEIHYFLARDFRLDPRLFKQCHDDARSLCGAEDSWHKDEDEEAENEGRRPLVFACLYRHLKIDSKRGGQLSRPCAFEVRRVMRQRAVSVELEPRIEEPCMGDLGAYCSEDVEKGREIQCLQRNYEELTEECQMAVGNFTEDTDINARMDRILMRACTPMINDFCAEEMKRDAKPGELMECLIRHKDDDDMDEKCAAGVKHHQMVSMEDFTFSVKFKEACRTDVLEHCKGKRKKFEVVSCLSELVRNDVLQDKHHTVSKKCRKQLTFEQLQRSEDVDLDPELETQCKMDIKKFCYNKTPGHSNIVDCLKKNEKQLSETCGKVVFKRQENVALNPNADFLLTHSCKKMIKQYCKDSEPSQLFACLMSHRDEEYFDTRCKKVMTERQRQRNTDYRLSPLLVQKCHADIEKFCHDVVQNVKNENKHEGKVIECLKSQFYQTHRLSEQCTDHMRSLIKEVAQDYQQDPHLVAACSAEINEFCVNEKASDSTNPDGGKVIECLKIQVAKAKITVTQNMECITQIARILAEDRADIQVDPLLYRECALDIKHYCHDVPRGEGRQMSCMLAALDDKKVHLKPGCKKMLSDRVKMWEMAADVAPANSLYELTRQVMMSESRNYFLGVIFTVIGLIFIGGLLCGRVTKRVRQETKDR